MTMHGSNGVLPRLRLAPARFAALLGAVLLSGCEPPPPEIFTASGAGSATVVQQDAGKNQVGEACHFQAADHDYGADYARSFDLYCGSWEQPSGHILEAKAAAGAGELPALADGGVWRTALEQRFACSEATSTSLLPEAPAVLVQCTQRVGGWPHVGLVTSAAGKIYYLDGVPSAAPALTTAVATLSGLKPPAPGERTSAVLISSSMAGSGIKSSDLQDYYQHKLMGDEANDKGDFAKSEQEYHAARIKQEAVLGPTDPALAGLLMDEALQVSNQDRFTEADRLFARASALVDKQSDPVLTASLHLYLAEHAANRGDYANADALASRAEAEYLDVGSLNSWVRDAVHATSGRAGASAADAAGDPTRMNAKGDTKNLANQLFLTADERSALAGVETTWWFQAYRAYQVRSFDTAEALAGQVQRLRDMTGFNPPGIIPRASEIAALSAAADGNSERAEAYFDLAAREYEKSRASERRAAQTLFLRGRSEFAAGQVTKSLADFRGGAKLLNQTRSRLAEHYVDAYVDALRAKKPAGSVLDEATSRELFEALQLVESGQTEQMLAKAFARLSTGENKAGDVLRAMQDQDLELSRLYAQREQLLAKAEASGAGAGAVTEIDAKIAQVRTAREQADEAAQAAAPAYAQLVEAAAPVSEMQPLLKPNEGLVAFHIGDDSSVAILIDAHSAKAYSIPVGRAELRERVRALRASIEFDPSATERKLPVFDVAAAHKLYQDLLSPVADDLSRLKRLVVVPNDALAALPLEVLVSEETAPVTDGNYARVPFLVEKLAISYIPSPQNLLVLRKNAKPSQAPEAYIGFGDFVPATPAQLSSSFGGEECKQDLAGLQQLPLLPGTRREVAVIGTKLFNAPSNDIILGNDFTLDRLENSNLGNYRVVHLATHALLPTDLHCLPEPTIVLSVPRSAANADAGFLRLSDITQNLKLDADLVILSACNTGKTTGDSLSALARGFFFAGSRGLLATHWELNDSSGALLAAYSLQANLKSGDSAEALQTAKLRLLHEVPAQAPVNGVFYTHPFAWAPFVLIGEGFQSGPAADPVDASPAPSAKAAAEPSNQPG